MGVGGVSMELMLDIIKDTLMIVPVIFIIYLILEYIEDKDWLHHRFKKAGPIVGGLIGILPECGTSIMASKLFSTGLISLGTLIAIFVSSSDEAVIILLTGSHFSKDVLWLLFLKLVFGILLGIFVNFLVHFPTPLIKEKIEEDHCHHHWRHAFEHTLRITLFVFISQVVISLIIAFIGEDQITGFLNTHLLLQPIIAGLIGLIPNCAGSMILAQVYLNGLISFGALFTGLSCSTGLGMLTLYRYHKNKKECLFVTLLIYFSALFAGYVFYR